MKKLLLLPFLLFSFLLSYLVQAQGNYQAPLEQALTEWKAAQTPDAAQSIANKMSRIAEAEPKEWLPAYYVAYSHISLSFLLKEEAQRDAVLDKAQTYLDRALKLQPNEAELHVLQGYLHQGRLAVSPTARGMKYSGLATASLEKAKQLNPENPRTYFLLGQNTFHMPKMFGGGPEAAKPILTTAKEKYAAYKPSSTLLPNWGERATLSLLEKCQ